MTTGCISYLLRLIVFRQWIRGSSSFRQTPSQFGGSEDMEGEHLRLLLSSLKKFFLARLFLPSSLFFSSFSLMEKCHLLLSPVASIFSQRQQRASFLHLTETRRWQHVAMVTSDTATAAAAATGSDLFLFFFFASFLRLECLR